MILGQGYLPKPRLQIEFKESRVLANSIEDILRMGLRVHVTNDSVIYAMIVNGYVLFITVELRYKEGGGSPGTGTHLNNANTNILINL